MYMHTYIYIYIYTYLLTYAWRGLRGVVDKILDNSIVVSKFELATLYYVHLRTNTLRKGISSDIV